MTTTATTELRRPVPRRMRRNLIGVLAAAALLAPTAFIVSRIHDNDSHAIAAPSSGLASGAVTAADVCSGGLGWACIFTPRLGAAPTETVSSAVTAADVCSGGLGWACIFTPQLGAAPTETVSSAVTAADVCSGGLGWACIFTPQLVGQS